MLEAGSPDAFIDEFMKSDMAVARLAVPAVTDIVLVLVPPIIAPIDIEIGVLPALPSIMPSAASFIMAVTNAEEFVMPRVLADCDIAASVMP